MQTFLVEHYRPGTCVDDLRRAAALVLLAAELMEDEGCAVRFLSTTVVPADEGFLSVIEASSEGAVRAAYARAGVACERISLALADGW